MNPADHADKQLEVRKALLQSHMLWKRANEGMNLAVKNWVQDVADRLLVASAGDPLRFHETFGTATPGDEVHVVAFTDQYRIDVRTTAPHGPTDATLTCTVRSRRGLVAVDVLRIDYWADPDTKVWPSTMALGLRYAASADDLTLGDGAPAEDWAAGKKLAAFYPSLLADLDRP